MSLFRGLDTDQYPGDRTMAALRAEADWCGYYLRAPSHLNSGWAGKRMTLAAQGWGVTPIFVGQQLVGPGSHQVTALQGDADGLTAAIEMTSEGFPAGGVCFLDLENGPPLSPQQAQYVAAWCAALRGHGFTPGIYCSHLMISAARLVSRNAPIWCFHLAAAAPVAIDGSAVAQQWAQNVGLHGLRVDLSVSAARNPAAVPVHP